MDAQPSLGPAPCSPSELTGDVIQEATGHEDMKLVQNITYCNKGLQGIGDLRPYINLTDLVLSSNRISRISGLKGLPKLKRLVLTSNNINRLEGLEKLPALQHLLVQANQVASVQAVGLAMLAELPLLRSLYLQNMDGTEANPVCSQRSYKSSVLVALPRLSNLDGERLPGVCPETQQAEGASDGGKVKWMGGAAPPAREPCFQHPSPPPMFHPESLSLPDTSEGGGELAGAVAAAQKHLDRCHMLKEVLLSELGELRVQRGGCRSSSGRSIV